jgi:hypothetical protein
MRSGSKSAYLCFGHVTLGVATMTSLKVYYPTFKKNMFVQNQCSAPCGALIDTQREGLVLDEVLTRHPHDSNIEVVFSESAASTHIKSHFSHENTP